MSVNQAISRVEYCNCGRGYLEEIGVESLNFSESLFGFTRQIVVKVPNAIRDNALLECGTATSADASSPFCLTDTNACFLRRKARVGDKVINTGDLCTVWEVRTVTSRTVLGVNFVEDGPAFRGTPCRDWSIGDGYELRRRNVEKVYVPNLTRIRITNRCTEARIFEGKVLTTGSVGFFSSSLEVVACSYDIQLRDAAPTSDAVRCETVCCVTTVSRIRSEVITNIFDDKTDVNNLVFPKVSGDNRSPGIEVSPNNQHVSPQYSRSNITALQSLLEMASGEQWTRVAITAQLSPATISYNSGACCTELGTGAEGNLATRFESNCQFCLACICLTLADTGTPTGNIYIRIETEEPTVGNTVVPSGYLVTPWAESNLINIADIAACPTCQKFTFDAPIPLAPCIGYWIVLSYQENNNTFTTCTTTVDWSRDNTLCVACATNAVVADLSVAVFACNKWTPTTTATFRFIARRFSEAVWLWESSPIETTAGCCIRGTCIGVWRDQTSDVEAEDANNSFLLANAAADSTEADRLYIGTAGPIRGLDFLYCTASNVEYGTWTVKYLGGHRAKVYGRVTTSNSGTCGICLLLIDARKDFTALGIHLCDIVYNISDNSLGVINRIANCCNPCNTCQLRVTDLCSHQAVVCGEPSKTFVLGDEYAILGWELFLQGSYCSCCACATSCTVLDHDCATFGECGVRVGDILVNLASRKASFITDYSCERITTALAVMDWAVGDGYVIYSRWRDLAIREIDNTFITPAGACGDTVTFEWTMPADWVARTFLGITAQDNGPQADGASCLNCGCQQRYWIVLQNDSIPSTAVNIDRIQVLPGAGFAVHVANEPRLTVICSYACAAHDGCINATALQDNSRDFFGDSNTVGIYACDTLLNEDDCGAATYGSTAVITDITSVNTAASQPHCTIVGTLANGTENDWDVGDQYVIKRCQYPLQYYRLGSRPFGGPTRYGLSLVSGAQRSCQIYPIFQSDVIQTSRQATNKVKVYGRNYGRCFPIEPTSGAILEDRRAQREYQRTVQNTIIDYNIKVESEADDAARTELACFVDAQERIHVELIGWPYSTKVMARKAWTLTGSALEARMEGEVYADFAHDGGNDDAALQDTSINFHKWGVKRGDLVVNITDGSEGPITAITTTTNANDTITATLAGSSNCPGNEWDCGDTYRILQRDMLEIGDIVRVRVGDDVGDNFLFENINEEYLITNICYTEPCKRFRARLSRNFSTASLGDMGTVEEIIQWISIFGKKVGNLFAGI